jgi:hypothetical protein
VEFERHILHSTDCGAELVAQDFLRGRVPVAQLYQTAPGSLHGKVGAQLIPVAPTSVLSQPVPWHWFAAAAALHSSLVAWRINPVPPSDDYQAEVAEEVVDAHMHLLQPGHNWHLFE